MKRGLVLAGGGAKGAYAFGALKALLESELRFDAVAGTSVGALNAALLALNSMSEGERIWTTISRSNVYPVRRIKLWAMFRRLEPLLTCLLRPLSIAYGLMSSAMSGVPTPFERPIRIAGAMLVLTPLLAIIWLTMSARAAAWAAFIATAALTLVQVRTRGRLTASVLTLAISTMPYAIGIMWAIVDVISRVSESAGWYPTLPIKGGNFETELSAVFALAQVIVLGSLFIAVSAGCSWILSAVSMRLEASLGSYMSSAPLSATLQNLVREGKFAIPCFVTVAKSTEYWDPDFSGWATIAHSAGMVPSPWAQVEHIPNRESAWTGEYLDISRLEPNAAAAVLMASAALPYGIVDPVRIGADVFVDGGVFDNTPAFPLIDLQLDEIWVILLNPIDRKRSCEQILGVDTPQWLQRERFLRVTKHPIPGAVTGTLHNTPAPSKGLAPGDQPIRIPHGERPRMPTLRIVAPQSVRFRGLRTAFRSVQRNPLGGLRDGTLNFRADYAKEVMKLGYDDALSVIKQAKARSGEESSIACG